MISFLCGWLYEKLCFFIYFRGTALSRNSIPRSSTVTSPTPSALSVHTLQDDQLPIVTFDISDDALPLPQTIDHQNEIRRPRVYFADYSKVQFIEDNNETSQQRHVPINDEPRQHRPRLFKKPSITNNVNRTSPSIQRSPARQNLICPSSRQPCHQIGQELNTKKQQSFISPHIYTSRITNLPDIVNQVPSIEPLSNENLGEKYALHREKPITRLLKPANDIPINLLLDFSSRITRNNIDRSSPIQDSSSESHKSDSGDSENRHLPNDNSPLSAISTNRQRPLLRTISLRQQFISPTKLKLTDSSSMTNINYHQPVNKSIPNTQQSTSLKISTSRTLDNNDDLHSNGPLLTTETRSMPGFELGKRLKRSYIIHYNSKKPFRTSTINYSNEANSHSNKPNVNGATQEDFQNLLTIVRPAFASGSGTSSNKLSTISNGSTTNHNRTTESTPLSHNTNLRGPLEFHLTSRTIIVWFFFIEKFFYVFRIFFLYIFFSCHL